MSALMGGMVGGMMVGDMMGAFPTRVAVPATTNASSAKADATGKPVASTATARQTLWISAAIVVVAVIVLLLGGRVLKDARIG